MNGAFFQMGIVMTILKGINSAGPDFCCDYFIINTFGDQIKTLLGLYL
jgi:hypothetical protein